MEAVNESPDNDGCSMMGIEVEKKLNIKTNGCITCVVNSDVLEEVMTSPITNSDVNHEFGKEKGMNMEVDESDTCAVKTELIEDQGTISVTVSDSDHDYGKEERNMGDVEHMEGSKCLDSARKEKKPRIRGETVKRTFEISNNVVLLTGLLESSRHFQKKSDGSKRSYSRTQLEALRFIGVEEQKEKWCEIYHGFGTELRREYDNIANSTDKKYDPSNSSSQRQPTGKKKNRNTKKRNHAMEVMDIWNPSSGQCVTEDGSSGLDNDCSPESDSDEDYHCILKPAFQVDGEPDFDSGPPEDGLEYLRRVRWEASRYPKVKVAKVDKTKMKNDQTDYMPKIPEIAKCPDHLLPSIKWEIVFLAQFENLRLAISSSQPSVINSSITVSSMIGEPTLSKILEWEPVTRVIMLRKRIKTYLPMQKCYPGKIVSGSFPFAQQLIPHWMPILLLLYDVCSASVLACALRR